MNAASVCDCPDFTGPVDTRHVCPVHGPLYADDGDAAMAAGCTCSSYYVDSRVVNDKTRCPIHMPLAQRRLSPMGGGPNPWKDKAR